MAVGLAARRTSRSENRGMMDLSEKLGFTMELGEDMRKAVKGLE